MRIGILKTDSVRPELAARYGEYPDMFVRLLGGVDDTLQFAVYDVENGEYPEATTSADAYLITGSKAGAYDPLPWIPPLEDYVRRLHREQRKLLGICFGHQVIAQALGGAVRQSPKGWGVGVHEARFQRLPTWHDGGDPTFRLLVSHQDQVVQLPPEADVLAGSEFCEHAVVQVGDHILTFQGHPEFETGYSRALLELRRERIGEPVYQRGVASLEQLPERERVGRWLVDFLRAGER
jgi:GMP synthase-like glutamine amidotransferase